MKRKVSILGSTGSIGTSALDVISRNRDRFDLIALAAGSNVQLLAKQIEKFRPQFVSVGDEHSRDELKKQCGIPIDILIGADGATAVALATDAEFVLSAMVGAAGLGPTYAAIDAGKTIGLANKETLVAAGEIMISKAREKGVKLLPIDSEHSAIFQSLEENNAVSVDKIILTASGGPFRAYEGDLANVTVEAALNHPNWSMGTKITIDSATMMNKGLEIIEAHWLFGLSEEKIEVVVHPESIVHSMVQYRDGSIIAQMGIPDMRTPISYALAYPERIESGVPHLDWSGLKKLTFFSPDYKKFPMLSIARDAIKEGGSMPAVMNAANEIAVKAFLERKVKFTDIFLVVSGVMEGHKPRRLEAIGDVFLADEEGRRAALEKIKKLG